MKQYTFGFTYSDGTSTIASGLYFNAYNAVEALNKIGKSRNVRISDNVVFVQAIELN